ncbi:MAG: 50S ribosomal protein L29 [Candidatus Gracilibacteria bacterium]
MKYAEYTKMSQEQLAKELIVARKSLFDISYQVQNKQSKANHEIKALKKSIAQLLTALNTGKTANKLENTEETVQNAPAKKEKAVKAPRKAKAKQA